MDLRVPPTVVSFIGTIVSNNRDDALREFIISFYLEDSSFAIVEKVVPNSGFAGGRFLTRTQVKNPATNTGYRADDVTVGRDVVIGAWVFHLHSANEGSLRTMEAKSDQFARSDLSAIIGPLRPKLKPHLNDLKTAFLRQDKLKRGRVKNEYVASILADFDVLIGGQELITLQRRFQFAGSDWFQYSDFLASLA
jgi:hypothetical protein